jgi:hypothetical protein
MNSGLASDRRDRCETGQRSQNRLSAGPSMATIREKRIGRRIMFVVEKPLPLEKESELTIRIRHQSQFGDHNIGRFRVSATSAPQSRGRS